MVLNKQSNKRANHLWYLQEMGITAWRAREKIDNTSTAPISANTLTWPELVTCVQNCQRCDLAKTRKQTVFGVGNRETDILFVGEAPGAREDELGEPFVGRAGQLLDAMLSSIGFDRTKIYIANIIKCRPPQNRDPSASEISNCRDYLLRQIELISPKVMVSLGRVSAQSLLNSTTPISRLRGKMYHFGEKKIPLFVTFHPAYLLRSPLEKAKAWEDLQALKKFHDAL